MSSFRCLSHGACLLTALILAVSAAAAQTFTRNWQVDVFVNQVGFVPTATKTCAVRDDQTTDFQVIRLEDQKVVYAGRLAASKGDFGLFSTGDFSAVSAPGAYYIKAGAVRSYPFRISQAIYDDALQMIVRYFSLQRCGPSTTGYLAPCHLDDGVRLDNGRHQNTTGGWHDASDLRKWFGATISGMIGLARVYEIAKPAWDRGQILDQLRWGNRYFLSMQEPAGYVMRHVGGDALAHGDSNRWTDNVIGPDGGTAVTIDPLPPDKPKQLSIMGNKDDRIIVTRPEGRAGQYKFIMTEAILARLTRSADADYAKKCLQAAERCFEWFAKTLDQGTADLGVAISAAIELHKTTGEQKYKDFAVASATRVIQLQVTEPIDQSEKIRGFFKSSSDNPEPYRDISNGSWHLIGLCDLIEAFPTDGNARAWREAVRLYASDYLAAVSKRNHFGIVPYGFFTKQDPGGSRQVGEYWYRYFMHPSGRPPDGWWVGINANLASNGVGLAKASRLLKDPSFLAAAQHQLDWIVGFNPLYSSTVVGVGHNHPKQFVNSVEFRPPTPQLPGAVMGGLGGTAEDQPALYDGSYHTAEYWTPMVAFTMWLMAALQAS